MQKSFLSIGAAAGALLLTHLAQAHSFVCEKTVNGSNVFEITSYPATLTYQVKVANSHTSDASTAMSATDLLLEPFWSFSPPAPFTLPVGDNVIDSFTLTLQSQEECMWWAGAFDGVVDDRIVNTFEVTWDRGSTQCSAAVICPPEQPPPPPPPPPATLITRTPGFFKTHMTALEQCIDGTDIGMADALGLLWGSPAVFDTGESRSDLDRARFLLARHLLVAMCNTKLFGSQPENADLVAQATDALFGGTTDCKLLLEFAEALDEFNNSGTEEDLPEDFDKGPATPRDAAGMADDPTTPSGEMCS